MKLSRFGGALAIIAFPFSVSLSQLGLFFAIAGWLGGAIVSRTPPMLFFQNFYNGTAKNAFGAIDPPPVPGGDRRIPAAFAYALAIYLFLLLSLLIRSALSNDFFLFFKKGMEDEVRDVLLVTAMFWSYLYSATEGGRRDLHRWWKIALVIMIAGGIVSVFSIYRLGSIPYFLSHGWESGAGGRLQHYLFTLGHLGSFPLHIYLPIGLMNTHLTYAAQLGSAYPFVFLGVVLPFLLERNYRLDWKRWALLLTVTLILMLNNGRSALLGIGFATLAALYYYLRTASTPVQWKRPLAAILMVFVVGTGGYFASPSVSNKMEKVVGPILGKSKTTDFQRIYLWRASIDIIRENLPFGVGAGHFEDAVNKKILEYSEQRPDLWFYFGIIQRGHSHNDLLHLLAIGGLLAAFFYLRFFFSLMLALFGGGHEGSQDWWRWGALVIFAGGLFQCYFLDDETMLPFWILAGMAFRTESDSRGHASASNSPES